MVCDGRDETLQRHSIQWHKSSTLLQPLDRLCAELAPRSGPVPSQQHVHPELAWDLPAGFLSPFLAGAHERQQPCLWLVGGTPSCAAAPADSTTPEAPACYLPFSDAGSSISSQGLLANEAAANDFWPFASAGTSAELHPTPLLRSGPALGMDLALEAVDAGRLGAESARSLLALPDKGPVPACAPSTHSDQTELTGLPTAPLGWAPTDHAPRRASAAPSRSRSKPFVAAPPAGRRPRSGTRNRRAAARLHATRAWSLPILAKSPAAGPAPVPHAWQQRMCMRRKKVTCRTRPPLSQGGSLWCSTCDVTSWSGSVHDVALHGTA